MKFRHEYKHKINTLDIYVLRQRLSAVTQPDPHAGTDGTYLIKSLYFDNYADTALREKADGVNKREKFRIRYYGRDTTFIRLEKKSKINGLCNKVSCRITADEVQKILDGNIGFLLESKNELMRELYAKMRYRLLRPKCIVAYNRECFIHPCGNVRITIDKNICASNSVREFLNPDLKLLSICPHMLLEVKWDEYLPQVIRDCVQLKTRQSGTFSKYAAARY